MPPLEHNPRHHALRSNSQIALGAMEQMVGTYFALGHVLLFYDLRYIIISGGGA